MTAETRAVVETLGRALVRLRSAVEQPKTEWTRDSAIQRFEFTVELAWKSVSRMAREEGIEPAFFMAASKARACSGVGPFVRPPQCAGAGAGTDGACFCSSERRRRSAAVITRASKATKAPTYQ